MAQVFVLGLLIAGIVFLRKGIRQINAKEARRGWRQLGIGAGCLALMAATVFILAQIQERQENEKASTEKQAEKQAEKQKEAASEKKHQVNVKVDRTKQSEDDDDTNVTRATEPAVVEGLQKLDPGYVKEAIVNVNLARKTLSENDTNVIVDVLFAEGTENQDKEDVFVEIAKALGNVKDVNKFTVWSYEQEMYNPDQTNQYMMVVYTEYLPLAGELTFEKLVDASNNGSIDGEMYFNQNRD